MSKRLQVVMDDAEYRELQRATRKAGMTVSDWVRAALRAARAGEPRLDPGRKVAAVRAAARHAYPTGEIDQMLDEIEHGYLAGRQR
jgi:hypothetical protein